MKSTPFLAIILPIMVIVSAASSTGLLSPNSVSASRIVSVGGQYYTYIYDWYCWKGDISNYWYCGKGTLDNLPEECDSNNVDNCFPQDPCVPFEAPSSFSGSYSQKLKYVQGGQGLAQCSSSPEDQEENICSEVPTLSCQVPPSKTCVPPRGSGTPVANMHISDAVMPRLKQIEGYNMISRNVDHVTLDKYGLYNDFAGFCTYGFGHLVRKAACTTQDIQDYNKAFPNGLTEAQAESLLKQDIQKKEREVSAALGSNVELTQYQFDALILLTFNTGAEGPLRKGENTGKIGEAIRSGNCDHTTIAKLFGEWNKVRDKNTRQLIESDALSMRRASEAALFNFGIYQ